MTNGSPSINDLKQALASPEMKNTPPDQIISSLAGMFGLTDLEAMDPEKCDEIRKVYFQAFTLKKDNWTVMPGSDNTVQIIPFKLKEFPEGTHLVADVLIDKTDYEAEVYDQYVTNIVGRGKSIIFYAVSPLPIDVTIGLKCVNEEEEPVFIDDSLLHAST